jgi:hypothetical protein
VTAVVAEPGRALRPADVTPAATPRTGGVVRRVLPGVVSGVVSGVTPGVVGAVSADAPISVPVLAVRVAPLVLRVLLVRPGRSGDGWRGDRRECRGRDDDLGDGHL